MSKITDANYNQLVLEAEAALASLVKAEAADTSTAQPLAKSEDKSKEDKKKDEGKEDKCDYDDSDVEEMHKMYSGMGKAELGIHKSSLEKAWVAKCGDMSVQKSETAAAAPLAKSEDAEKLSKAEEAANLAKAELADKTAKLEAATKEAEVLKKNITDLTAALSDFVSKKGPQRKAVTDISKIEVIKKSDSEIAPSKPDVSTLSKSEVTSRLNKKACEPSLSKADREAINKYCLVPGTSLDTVKHLLS